MTNGPRKLTVWCTAHRYNVTAEADGALRHAPAGDLCDGTDFFMTTERRIDRDTAAAELARFTLPMAGEVYEGTARISSTRGDFTEVETRVIPEGVLQVTSHFQAVKDGNADGTVSTIGWQVTLREAKLNGEPVTDPLTAQVLAGKSGIRWNEP